MTQYGLVNHPCPPWWTNTACQSLPWLESAGVKRSHKDSLSLSLSTQELRTGLPCPFKEEHPLSLRASPIALNRIGILSSTPLYICFLRLRVSHTWGVWPNQWSDPVGEELLLTSCRNHRISTVSRIWCQTEPGCQNLWGIHSTFRSNWAFFYCGVYPLKRWEPPRWLT